MTKTIAKLAGTAEPLHGLANLSGRDTAALPARVLLLGVDTPIGLAIIRELGEHGVEVHGIARSVDALGLRSRYLKGGHVRAGNGAALARQVRELATLLTPCFVMAISESDIVQLNAYRAELTDVHLLIPPAAKMRLVLDKNLTQGIAAEVGIAVPRTVSLSSLVELDKAAADLSFPVVLKWPDPNAVARQLETLNLPLEKAAYCHSIAELHDKLRRYADLGCFPLIQEFCPGYGLGQFLFMHRGEALLQFQHKRVHEWPPEGGFSSLCEALPVVQHSDLMARSIALLRKMAWEGPAMVEYRYDPATDSARLMEVNGRFWGSLPLAYHAGAPFAWLTYAVLGNGAQVSIGPYRAGLRCRFMVPEIKRLMRILFQAGHIQDRSLVFNRPRELWGFLADFFNPRTRYYVFSLRDSEPFFADLYNMGRRAAGWLFRKRRPT